MDIYLPIAEISINALVILLLGGAVGVLSGLFGVGGGFLMTPLLIFFGVPPAIAVGTQANQLVAASLSGALGHWRRGNVDLRLGTVMLAGGALGTALGVWIFALLQRIGQIDLVISLLYVVLLGTIGALMLNESLRAILAPRRGRPRRKLHPHNVLHGLPFKMRFPRSRLYVSAMLPAGIGLVGGLLVALMGIGGGFLLVPAMIYLLGMPAAMVAGTSLYQIIFTTALATVLQAITNHSVDIVLAALLIVGGVVGAQIGTLATGLLKGEQVRAILGALVVVVAGALAFELVQAPADPFVMEEPAP